MDLDSPQPASAADGLPQPPTVPDHELLKKIGGGGYGEVWLARNLTTGVFRAVKVVYRSWFAEERPFQREFEGVKRFEPLSREHKGLVDVLQVGQNSEAGFFYYVMELADDASVQDGTAGETGGREFEAEEARGPSDGSGAAIDPATYVPKTLRALLRGTSGASQGEPKPGRALPPAQCARIASDLADALAHLHAHKLVHRDVKPSNIIFVNGQPKLADIGLVAAAGEEASFVGTEAYAAPEGPGKATADIFALGVVLHEMLTGLPAREYLRLNEGWKQAPELEERQELRHVVVRACEGDRARRYQTAEAMHLDLELLRAGHSLAFRRLQRKARRALGGVVALLVLVVLAYLVSGFFVFRNRAAEQNRQRELRALEISRMKVRGDGWFSNDWARLERAAAVRTDRQVLEHASALLAGWDARLVTDVKGAEAASAAFCPDGRALAGGAGASPALILDTNGMVTRLPARGEGPVCWAADGTPLQLLVVSNRLVLRDARTCAVRREFALPDGVRPEFGNEPVLAIAPDGGMAAAAVDGRVVVWQATNSAAVGEVKEEPTALAFAPDSLLLAAGGEDGTARVYALPGLTQTAILPPALRGSAITCFAFTRNRLVRYGETSATKSWLLAIGDQGANIVIWDLDRRMPRTFCRGSDWLVAGLAFSPDGLILASCGRNQARLWNVPSGQPLLLLEPTSTGESSALAFDTTGRWLVCGGFAEGGESRVGLWRLEPDRGIMALRGLEGSGVRKVWFSRDSERVAALSDDWHLAVWNVGTGAMLFTFETPVGVFADNAGGCFDATGNRFAFATGREARLYDLRTGIVLKKWTLAAGLSDQLQYDATGHLLLLRRERASARRPSIWRLYELGAAQRPVLVHEQPRGADWRADVTALPFGARRFIVCDGDATGRSRRLIHAYDTASGRELWRARTPINERYANVCLDPTGKWFGYDAYTGSATPVRLMRWSDFTEVGRASAAQAISPSGRQVATLNLLFPDITRPDYAIPTTTRWGALNGVRTFSPDGKLLAWGTEEGAVLVARIEALRRRLAELSR